MENLPMSKKKPKKKPMKTVERKFTKKGELGGLRLGAEKKAAHRPKKVGIVTTADMQPHVVAEVTFESIAEVTGEEVDTVRRHKNRGYFALNNPLSLACYIARFGTPEARQKIMQFAVAMHAPGVGIPKPGLEKRA